MDAGKLVARAAARLGAEQGWVPDPALRKLPEVTAILKAPDDVRRECVLMLAAHLFDEDDPALALCGRRLLQLLPGLAIADRCRLEDRFLAVRGQLRSYRIHLGSGNVLMEPGSEFLPVGARRADEAIAGLIRGG